METWLRGEAGIEFEGYSWFGNNRKCLNSKAVRGSGGVGFLVRNDIYIGKLES